MLWLALFAPELPFDLLKRQGHPPQRPAALLASDGRVALIAAVNAAAHRAGLTPGQSLAHAHTLAPGLLLLRRDPKAEDEALERLASCAYRFSDRILLAEGAVLLEVGGSLRLFGDVETLLARLHDAVSPLGLTLRQGLAPEPELALLLARSGGGRLLDPVRQRRTLAALPLAAAPLPSALVAELAECGLSSVGGLLQQPRAALGERFGPELVAWLARLLGERPPPYPAFVPQERFHAALDLPQPAHTVPELAFALRRLCQELAACLSGRHLGVERFLLCLRSRQSLEEIEVSLRSPAAQAERLFAAAETVLAVRTLRGPVLGLSLEAEALLPLLPSQGTLWGTVEAEGRLAELIERLEQRLGEAAVYRLGLIADHRPERAFYRLSASADVPPAPAGCAPAGERPTWLLPAPRAVAIADYTLLAGPERIESGWWDGADIRRDYYLARDRAGRRCWLFRDRRGWFLHGFFA